MGYQVFVERPTSAGPDAIARLAAAMAERYGIARADLEPRLRAGRFRVKNNVDRETAEKFAADLEKLGAIVSIVDEQGASIARAKPSAPAPAAKPAPKPAPAPAPKPAPAATPAPAPRPSAPQFASGLAAAFGAKSDEPDLGALGETSGSFALSALDGSDDHPVEPSGSFAPPGEAAALPASIGPAIAAPASTPPPKPAATGDMFAPPDSEEELVDLAVDMADLKAQRTAATSTPPSMARSAGRVSAPPPVAGAPSAPVVPSKSFGDHLRAFAGNRRARFAVGAVLAVLIGFLPAHLLASVRERSAYAEIDSELAKQAAALRTTEAWQAFDQVRDSAHEEKLAEKHSIAITAVLLWAAVSAGFVFVWYRKIDWDRLAGP